jgi:dynein heavy chain
MEEWLVENAKDLNLPPVKNDETIFEYLVNEQGAWEHWYNRVSKRKCLELVGLVIQ